MTNTITLSAETITTAYNALRGTRFSIKRQLNNENIKPNAREILEHQLEEVEDALFVFEELMDII